MTPQSDFMVLAPVAAGREADLRAVLDSMNSAPGSAAPGNAVLPFGEFESLHFARLAILDDFTVGDFELHGLPRPQVPRYLALMGNCDGPAHDVLADLARRAGAGLRQLYSHCEQFDPGADLLAWLLAHDVPGGARYVNWRGRTVRQVHEESALQRALSARVPRSAAGQSGGVQAVRRELVAFVQGELRAGRLSLTPPAATPFDWRIANLAHAVAVPVVGVLALPLVLLMTLPFVYLLRRRMPTRIRS